MYSNYFLCDLNSSCFGVNLFAQMAKPIDADVSPMVTSPTVISPSRLNKKVVSIDPPPLSSSPLKTTLSIPWRDPTPYTTVTPNPMPVQPQSAT